MKPMTIYLPVDDHKRLGVAAAMMNVARTTVVQKIVADYLARNQKVIDQAMKVINADRLL